MIGNHRRSEPLAFVGLFGNDTITDFDPTNANERIDLSGVSEIDSFADLMASHLNLVGMDAVITDGLGNSITLTGVAPGDLEAADFIF